MSHKSNEPKSTIGDLPETTDELSGEALDQVAGGVVRNPGKTGLPIGRPSLGADATVMATLSADGQCDSIAKD